MHTKTIDWDDLRYVLQVAQKGSIAAAAESLNVNRTTVLRRINQFEQHLDYRLFDRHGAGYALAPGAEALLSAAMDVEKSINDLHRQILGKEVQLQGHLSITTTDAILKSTVAPHLATFHKKHPQIKVELVVSNHRLSLSRREADVAIRPGETVPDNLVGYPLGPIEFNIFAGKSYMTNRASLGFDEHTWLGVDNPLLQSPPGQWVSRNIPEQRICLKADSFVALCVAAELGMGLTVLPQKLGQQSSELIEVFPEVKITGNQLWVVTHPDLVRSARVHAFIEHIQQAMLPDKK